MKTPRNIAMKAFYSISLCVIALAAAPTRAQITNPGNLVAPPPAPPAMQQREPQPEDLHWLWQYAQSAPTDQKAALLADPRFAALLKDQLKTPQVFWGKGVPLSDAAAAFLAGEGRVTSIGNRYLTITGCIADQCGQQGLLWIDLGMEKPLLVFTAMRWAEQSKTPDQPGAPFSLWLFSNRNLDELPQSFKTTLSAWLESSDCAIHPITVAAIVDTDGTPHAVTAGQLGIRPLCMTTASTGNQP